STRCSRTWAARRRRRRRKTKSREPAGPQHDTATLARAGSGSRSVTGAQQARRRRRPGRGVAAAESRRRVRAPCRGHGPLASRPDVPRPKWDGSPLNGRALFVHTEQGVGDVLMFLRFLPRAKRGPGDRLVFACQKALQPLLRNIPWVDEWFPIDEVGAINFNV